MSPALVISKREIRHYFNSPVAYIVVTVFTIVFGFFFFNNLFVEKQADMRGFFSLAPLMFCFFAPAITMRLLAEEKGSGTIELLITMPVRDWEVVVGKWLASMVLLLTTLALTMVFAVTVAKLGPLDKGPAFGGYLGLMLMGGSYLAIGVMASSLTRNQVVSLIVAFGICFALFLLGKVLPFIPEKIQPLVAFLSTDTHFENVSRGVIDSRDVIYYLSVIVVTLLIATTSLESRKWK
ncbi:MAG TPA: ABC transporter permease subunit [Polyangia bacterium]|nr:ABC transporter permease subunit [Polyangia bacterium]